MDTEGDESVVERTNGSTDIGSTKQSVGTQTENDEQPQDNKPVHKNRGKGKRKGSKKKHHQDLDEDDVFGPLDMNPLSPNYPVWNPYDPYSPI